MRRVISCTLSNWIEHNPSNTGAALAFYCAFSLAPLLIIVMAFAGWIVGETAAFDFVQAQLQQLFGSSTARLVLDAMHTARQTQGILATIVSVATLLVGATTVLAALNAALERILGGTAQARSEVRTWLRRRFLSLGFILALSFLLLVSLTISTAIAGLRSWAAQRYAALVATVGVLDVLLSIGLMTALFAVIYRYVPARRLAWKQVASGGLLTATLFSIGKWLVGLYLARSTVPSAFGAAASFAALLLWLYYTSQVFLLGAEFTACLGGLRKGGTQPAPATGSARSRGR